MNDRFFQSFLQSHYTKQAQMCQKLNSNALHSLSQVEEDEVHSFRLAIAQAAAVSFEATRVFSNEYLFSVLHVENRAFTHAVTKMARSLKWRRMYQVDTISWKDVKVQLTSGSMYWYGYDVHKRPILWVRAMLKDWQTMSSRRTEEVRAHVYMVEMGCRRFMPPGVTTFTIVTDSSGLGLAQVDYQLMQQLLEVCVNNFPDRIGLVHAGPLTRMLKLMTSWLWPLLPIRLRGKISLLNDCAKELAKHMATDLIPLHMGGTAIHNLREPQVDSLKTHDIMEVSYMIQQQARCMEEIIDR
ncbi:hypothetical protein CCR75_003594 [Bremia lactucae]|uniref:CRAL-TRIO domain-containing protein n=1 Tax=Bremia lactucae TaxID=4779 RepID=A0A976IB54_BRELC|nr:hypothetical protein CCR75_003594 [Bremia lactucae]